MMMTRPLSILWMSEHIFPLNDSNIAPFNSGHWLLLLLIRRIIPPVLGCLCVLCLEAFPSFKREHQHTQHPFNSIPFIFIHLIIRIQSINHSNGIQDNQEVTKIKRFHSVTTEYTGMYVQSIYKWRSRQETALNKGKDETKIQQNEYYSFE